MSLTNYQRKRIRGLWRREDARSRRRRARRARSFKRRVEFIACYWFEMDPREARAHLREIEAGNPAWVPHEVPR